MSARTARDVIAKWCASNADRAQDIPYYDTADLILSALRSAGFAVVPVEPTEVMIREGFHTASGARDIYKAMITAAQEDSRG